MFRSIFVCFTFMVLILPWNPTYLSHAQSSESVPEKVSEHKGLTFSSAHYQDSKLTGVFLAVCGGTDNQRECDPFGGDMLCKTEQPVLCFLDIDAPVPTELDRPKNWTAGVLALTKPIRGSHFARLSDANAYCTSTFGEGWRVASFHDGGGWALIGYGLVPLDRTRFWVDIKDQPNGTCWSR